MYAEQKFPTTPDQVAAARRFTEKALKGQPAAAAEVAVLIVSELATNAVKYATPGTFQVAVATYRNRCEVRVDDSGGDSAPHLKPATDADECWRGLYLVAELASRWQILGGDDGGPHAVRAELDYAA